MSSDNSKVVGVLLITRHGDRQGFYQDPTTYDASGTSITPLGEVQQYQLGTLIKNKYLTPSSASYIQGIAGGNSSSLVETEQVLLYADASDEGGVIYDSAVAFTQGLWPAAGANSNTTLANGTTVVSPLNGYQYTPVVSILSDSDVSLEGWTSCPKITSETTAFYNTPGFKAVNDANSDFLANLTDIVNGRPVNLQNMWNIFDYMNVQSIHNATFLSTCPPNILARARGLANYHEAGIFSSTNASDIKNVPGTALLPTMFSTFNRLANSSDPLLFHSIHMSYKPFLSLFQLMNITAPNGNLTGIINYAGSTAFEVRVPTNGSDTPFLRVSVKNGTDDADYHVQTLFNGNGTGSVDISVADFESRLKPYALETRSAWCEACGNNSTRTCNILAELNSTTASLQSLQASTHGKRWSGDVSPVAAGFIGFAVTFVVMLALLGLLACLGLVAFGDRKSVV